MKKDRRDRARARKTVSPKEAVARARPGGTGETSAAARGAVLDAALEENRGWAAWLKPLSVALLAGLVFLPALRGEFLWDDTTQIVENETLRTAAGLKQIWSDPGSQMQYYPLTYTTYWVEHQFWKLSPTGYHVVNFLLHAANAMLVYFILRGLALPGAWLAAALFAVHPVQAESVAWIAERKNVLASLFYLAALLFWLRFGRTRRWVNYAGALVCFAGGLLSKTVVVTLPVVLLILEWWRPRQGWKRAAALLAPFFIMAVVFGWLTVGVESQYYAGGKSGRAFSLLNSLLISTRALAFYLSKLAWPAELLAIYPKWTIDPKAAWQYAFPLGVAAALALLWLLRRRWGRGPLCAAFFFIITLGPVLGFVDFGFLGYSYVADRYLYLACLGPFAVVATLLAGGAQRLFTFLSARAARTAAETEKIAAAGLDTGAPSGSAPPLEQKERPAESGSPPAAQWKSVLAIGGGAALVLGCAVVSWKQGGIYRDGVAFWGHNLAGNPTHIAHSALGDAYAKQGDWEQAEACQRRSVECKDNARARLRLGELYEQRGEFERVREELLRAAQVAQADNEIRPLRARIAFNLGAWYWNHGGRDRAQCIAYWQQASKLDPRLPGVRNWLARAQAQLQRAKRGVPPAPP